MLGFLPGMSKEDIIRREVDNGDLNARGTGFADRKGSWNWQDSFGAFLAGTNKEEVLRGATEKRNKQFEEAYSGQAKDAAANLGPLASSYQGVAGKTRQEIESAIKNDERRGSTLLSAQVNNPYLDVSQLKPGATPGDIAALSGRQLKAGREKDAETATQKVYAREDALTERLNIREDRKDARAALERAQARKDELSIRRDNLQLEYARLAQADRQKAQDRKDKAFMMLIQGLGNLGSAFTL